MNRPVQWRSMFHPPARGSWNMAVDEALLRTCATGEGVPTLRCYGWAPYALSIGAHQDPDRTVDRDWLQRHGVDLVRRPTGGRAVLHARELTYSVTAPTKILGGGVTEIYRQVAEALRIGLERLGIQAEVVRGKPSAEESAGPQPCFVSPARYEFLHEGRKLIGSAQRQVDGAWLQHGSVPFEPDEERVRLATGRSGLPGGWMAGLEEAAGRALDMEEVASALERGFSELFGVAPDPGGLTRAESVLADRLENEKYATASWTMRGRVETLAGTPSLQG